MELGGKSPIIVFEDVDLDKGRRILVFFLFFYFVDFFFIFIFYQQQYVIGFLLPRFITRGSKYMIMQVLLLIVVYCFTCYLPAVEWTLFGCFWTNGQICSATSRLLVHVSVIPSVLNTYH
jgi:hypothetical protein